MRNVARLSLLLILSLALAGCTGGSDRQSATTPTTTAAVAKKDAAVVASADVSAHRTVRIAVVQDGTELKSASYMAMPDQKNVKREQFTHSVAAKDFTLRVFEGTNPVGTEKVQPQTCSGAKVTVEVHLTNDAVHITWKCG